MHWQTRILKLQSQMQELAEHAPLTPPTSEGSGVCALSAYQAFEEAPCDASVVGRDAVRRFGRQTVWCTVALLRRVLREASWPTGDRVLTSAQAEARLASLAVAAIGGTAVSEDAS